MIFVTVGTHEQGFDRLIKEVDRLKEKNIIKENVVIQKGYTEYEPKFCETYKLLEYDVLQKYLEEARIVITHGGPASFMAVLQSNKIPIVVPRDKSYNEHINNHQIDFAKYISEKLNTIILILDICNLENVIINYDQIVKKMMYESKLNNDNFCNDLERIVQELLVK